MNNENIDSENLSTCTRTQYEKVNNQKSIQYEKVKFQNRLALHYLFHSLFGINRYRGKYTE